MSKVVKITTDDNNNYTIDCQARGCITYLDLKKKLEEDGVEGLNEDSFFLIENTQDAVEDEANIDFDALQGTALRMKVRCSELRIFDLGQELSVRVPNRTTVADLKKKIFEQYEREISVLTVAGQELKNSWAILDEGITDGSELIARIEVEVEDTECDLKTKIETYPFCRLRDVLEGYKVKLRRSFPLSAVEVERDYDLDQTLEQLQITHDSSVLIKTRPFKVCARYKNRNVSFEVSDHMTVKQVKEKYDTLSPEVLEADDKLRFQGRELEDEQRLYQIPGLYPQKEPQSESEMPLLELVKSTFVIFHKYVCADCGSEVRIKKGDAIMCHECGYRIVYKRRTLQPQQYLSR
jgi:DNA-directed RNA polymerase subunit RPC12/RpoP